MTISLICATSKNGIIGIDNKMPWHLTADMRYFKQLTSGHHLVMGRKTYESIGRPLPGRITVIITRQTDYNVEGCLIAHSLSQAIELCQDDDHIFIAGGGTIYQQSLSIADRIYLTRIHHAFEGDTFMFDIDPTIWQETSRQDFEPDEKNKYPYSFTILEKL
ncbi:MAG: dihydrofolate reductase [Chloroflexota bacterium]